MCFDEAELIRRSVSGSLLLNPTAITHCYSRVEAMGLIGLWTVSRRDCLLCQLPPSNVILRPSVRSRSSLVRGMRFAGDLDAMRAVVRSTGSTCYHLLGRCQRLASPRRHHRCRPRHLLGVLSRTLLYHGHSFCCVLNARFVPQGIRDRGARVLAVMCHARLEWVSRSVRNAEVQTLKRSLPVLSKRSN